MKCSVESPALITTLIFDQMQRKACVKIRSVEIAEDLLRHVEHVLGQDLNAIVIDSLSAIHEVISLDVWELLSKALAILILFLVTRSVSVEAVGNNCIFEAVVLAQGNT